MRIIRDQAIVDDAWRHDTPGEEFPAGDIIVSLRRCQSERDQLLARGTRLGVRLTSADHPQAIAHELAYFAVIALEFDVFGDGRAYSQARMLRERYRYRGEIRAVGDVRRDQLLFMQRCGINAFEVRAERNIEDTLAAFAEFSVTLQPAADDSDLIFHRRELISNSVARDPRTIG